MNSDNISVVVKNDLCISCSACKHVCPFGNIKMKYDNIIGKWQAEIQDRVKCGKCNGKKNCLSVCQGYGADYVKYNSSKNGLLGDILNIYSGYSNDEKTRYQRSSGGFIKEAAGELLSNGDVNGVISLMHKDGLEYEPQILIDLQKMPNSIYHNVNFENAMDLLKNNDGKYLLIGLPCQITSIDLLLTKAKYAFLKEKIYAKICLICGYTFDRANAAGFSSASGLNLEKIEYRTGGRYRKIRITDKSGFHEFDVKNPRSFHEFINNILFFDKLLVQKGCLFCVNHIGYTADLAVGDAWQERYSNDNIGRNIIISRTQIGENIIRKMKNYHFDKSEIEEVVEAEGEEYAYGSIGESVKSVFRTKIYPLYKRTDEKRDVKIYRFSLSDVIKIILIKRLILKRRYAAAKAVFILISLKRIIKYLIFSKNKNT